jgi:hypothetical protein
MAEYTYELFYHKHNSKPEGYFDVIRQPDGEVVFTERTDLANSEQRARVASRIANLTQRTLSEVERDLIQLAALEERRLAQERQSKRKVKEEAQAQAPAQAVWEPDSEARQEAEKLLERSDLLAQIVNVIDGLGVVGERALTALAYLVCTSRLTPKPLYLLCQGEPASGKSYILETVAQTMPPGIVESITDLTPQALFYLQGINLQNRILLLGERRRQTTEESIDSTKAIRELHESGQISKLIPIKKDGYFQAAKITITGCPAILESCSHGAIAQEDLTRAIVCWTDDSEEQTKKVIAALAKRKALGTQAVGPEQLEAIWTVQWLLEPYEVVIQFLPRVAEKFPAALPEARRAFVRLAALIEASALLHQRQRKTTESKLWADPDDFRLAWRLLRPWLRHRLVEAPPPSVERIWTAIRHRAESFTRESLSKAGLGNRATIGRALRYLEQVGAIQAQETGPRGQRPYRVVNPSWEPGDLPAFDLDHCLSSSS